MTEPPIKVTLVHGTFASDAKWIREGSRMADALDAAGISHEPFVWSGGNSHKARMEAADDLAKQLREGKQDGVRQAVVAHSHGGNIAIHAVWRLMQVRDGSIPIVALATPFLFANRKKIFGPVLSTACLMAVAILPAGIALAVLLPIEGADVGPLWLVTLILALWVVVVAQVAGFGYWLAKHGRPWDTDAQNRFISLVQAPYTDGGGLLVVRAADDEASTGLAISQLAGWLSATAARLSRPQSWTPVYAVLTTIGLILTFVAERDVEDAWFLVIAVASALACLLSLVLVSAPALLSLSHGIDGPTASLFALVSAEASPPGQHEVIQRPIRNPTEQGLSHSSLYDDKDVIGWVIDHVSR